MEAWIWILLLLFLLFRFVLMAKKEDPGKKEERGGGREKPSPPPPRGDREDITPWERPWAREERDNTPELDNLFQILSGAPPARPARPPRRVEKPPPKPPPPKPVGTPFVEPLAAVLPEPTEKEEFRDFDLPPLPRAVVWSEVLGTPKGLRFNQW